MAKKDKSAKKAKKASATQRDDAVAVLAVTPKTDQSKPAASSTAKADAAKSKSADATPEAKSAKKSAKKATKSASDKTKQTAADDADKKAKKSSKKTTETASDASSQTPASTTATKGQDATEKDAKGKGKKKAKKKDEKKGEKKGEKSGGKKKVLSALDGVSFSETLRVGEGFQLADVDANATPGWDEGRKAAEKYLAATADELADLQERLYASERTSGGRSVLLVVQGMDTAGKGGIMRHVVGQLDPQGVSLTAFKQPTKEEQRHPFLWRIRNALPKPGFVGVFDRSHYEDVLVVRVHDLVSRAVWMRRYGQINTFEATTASKGTTIIKVMLHIDADEQKARLTERLDNPQKHYKFNPGDITERHYWDEYQAAYQTLLERTSTDVAPWYVIPANNKWYARLAVQQLLLEHLRELNLTYPEGDFDVAEQKRALAES